MEQAGSSGLDTSNSNGTDQDKGRLSALHRLLEDARRRLVDTGTRNRLVHVNRKNTRANAINIINERSDDIFDLLAVARKSMRFLPIGKDEIDEEDETDTPSLGELDSDDDVEEGRFTDRYLETRMTSDALQKRLLRMAKDAGTAEEEQGVNILYLAIGFMTWFEDKSSAVQREAPLLLLPVQLRRNEKTSKYEVAVRDDDLVTNLPLKERLMGDYGLALPEVEMEEEWSPSIYFDEVDQIIKSHERWSIDRDGMQLGFFSFGKLLMLRDLDPENWPGDKLEENPLVSGLLYSSFESEPPLFGVEDRLDEKLVPADIIQVVDADASQTKVIEEVRSGRNLVVEGPPGTGKSQTITNIIASAVADGKRVLFMAEKMAALNVVHGKLKSVGLDATCLELHSRFANKKAVHQEIRKTLTSGRAVPSMPDEPNDLLQVRDLLNKSTSLLHRKLDDTGETPFDLIGEQVRSIGQGLEPPEELDEKLGSLSKEGFKEAQNLIRDYADLISELGAREINPCLGIRNMNRQPIDLQRDSITLERSLKPLERIISEYRTHGIAVGLDAIPTLVRVGELQTLLLHLTKAPTTFHEIAGKVESKEEWEKLTEALRKGVELQKLQSGLKGNFIDEVVGIDLLPVRPGIVTGTNSFFARLRSPYRKASAELAGYLLAQIPKAAESRLGLVDSVLEYRRAVNEFAPVSALLASRLGDDWNDLDTPFEAVLEFAFWCREALEISEDIDLKAALQLLASSVDVGQKSSEIGKWSTDFKSEAGKCLTDLQFDWKSMETSDDLETVSADELSHRLERMAQLEKFYGDWCRLNTSAERLDEAGLPIVRKKLESEPTSAETVIANVRFGRAEVIWKKNLTKDLQAIAQTDRHKTVKTFQNLENKRMKDCRVSILAGHLSQLPSGAVGEMGVIRSELGKKSRHKALRVLMDQAGGMLQRIKPVFLMSPVSVAQFLPPGKIEFDLLVIDEASQVRPEDALGAIARSKQLVVVGDQKQMPPSSFFDRMTSNDDDVDADDDSPLAGAARATELESILSLGEARGLGGRPRMLEWHYRSRDPSLIAVSNEEFYNGNLILPPSPLQNDDNYGLSLVRVNGVYNRGQRGKNVNNIEAEEIVKRVAEHARKTPDLSLGIATFSNVQKNHVNELLELARRSDAVLDGFLREGKTEDVFVKNLENVQGDERDVILVSVCYGPTEPGGRLMSLNFGPVNGEGGERRLNVLFTRARIRCEVFCSFDPGDIDPTKSSHVGVRTLKRFLDFAKTGILRDEEITGLGADSPFEEDVADEIRKMGYLVDHQVGSAGFLIDLAIRRQDRPGQFILAVECDGATYHSALWARERDRLRQNVLEHLGWRFHRIWSTDWFYRRTPEIERLRRAIEEAAGVANDGIVVKGANSGNVNVTQSEPAEEEEPDLVFDDGPLFGDMPLYKRHHFSQFYSGEPHQAPINRLAQIASAIVRTEGPIHHSEVARRLAEGYGKRRAGTRINEMTVKALRSAARSDEEFRSTDGFWFTLSQQEAPPVRDRSAESGTLLKAEMIASMEIEAAGRLVLDQSGECEEEELVRAIAQIMGFKRTGPELKKRFGNIVRPLLSTCD